jgi:hypothetical protein
MLLHIVGVFRSVIWRDDNITNDVNSSLFEQMKQRYAFNIYSAQTSLDVLDTLKFN